MTKQTLTREGWAKLESAVKDNPILDNAFRLMADADLLFAHARYSSALALAVLSMEEVGKWLLSTWSQDAAFKNDKRRLHRMKQSVALHVNLDKTAEPRRETFTA